jgi:hypothetical protein
MPAAALDGTRDQFDGMARMLADDEVEREAVPPQHRLDLVAMVHRPALAGDGIGDDEPAVFHGSSMCMLRVRAKQ